jgi:hydroxymethylbilane synthase
MARTLTIGTRGSKLALWQTEHVAQRLEKTAPGVRCRIETLVTQGDRRLDQPLPEIGGKGLFTAELEEALRRRQIDLAVHSLKDLPVDDTPGLVIGAILSRADVRDVLVARGGWTLATLPHGAVVGTSSLRRQAQLLAVRSDLAIRSIRGNVDTRVRKVISGEYDAALFAGAGLLRLGLESYISEWLSVDLMLPAPGQGALAVQCRADDLATLDLLAAIDDRFVRTAVWIERQFLQGLGGGCSAPIGAYAIVGSSGRGAEEISAQAVVGTPDGRRLIRVEANGAEPEAVVYALLQNARAAGSDTILAARAAPTQAPLQGRRIVVTRTTDQARDFRFKLQSAGATVVEIPAIRIVPVAEWQPLDEAIGNLSRYNWILFTSSNAVEIFWQRLAALGEGAALPAALKVGAVGSATGEALRERGVEPDLTPGRYSGEDLAQALPNVEGARILLPRASAGRRELVEILQARGAVVDDIAIYHTEAAPIDPAAMAELEKGVDAITFTSGSTARHFAAGLNQHGKMDLLARTLLACIGLATAETVRELGLQPGLVAAEQTIDGLTAALIEHFRDASRSPSRAA